PPGRRPSRSPSQLLSKSLSSSLPSRRHPLIRGSSWTADYVQLLGHFPERLHALRIVDVLTEHDLVRSDPDHFPVIEKVTLANEVTLVVGRANLRDVTIPGLPDAVDHHLVDRHTGDP